MRKRLLDQLWVGNMADCQHVHEGWSVVHACKHKCYHEKCGQLKHGDKNYFSFREGAHLYLNIIDASEPLFNRRVFEDFITFARGEWQTGRPLLIHCNKGESRAPSLALLFLAKVLYKITDASYDEAWQEFEELAGEAYTPSKGIEQWLREHWKEIDGGKKLPSMAGAAEEKAVETSLKSPEDPAQCAALLRSLPLYHFSACTQIEDKEHKWIRPEPNSLQFDIAEAYDWSIKNNLPCRLIILKPRQVGCSTFCGHLCYHHMRRFQSDGIFMGDVRKRTLKIYEIYNSYHTHDIFPWDSTYSHNTEKGFLTYSDGSVGAVEHDTAQDSKAGISGTRQVVWLTEAGRYPKTGNRDKKVITAVLGSLADAPKTLAIMESTAEGANGVFYDTYQGAATLEQRKKGILGNGWIRVFAKWSDFREYELARTSFNDEYFEEGLDELERRGVKLYGWRAGQIAWRRKTLKGVCSNDIRMLNQDYPEDEESAFLASGRPAFDMAKLVEMEARAKVNHGLAKKGFLTRDDRGEIAWTEATDGAAWLWVDEMPTPGHYYVGFIDPCMGEQSEGSLYPDAHGAGIWRDSYIDGNTFYKKKLVAMIDVETGCRWPDWMVSERLKMVLDFYGGCPVVPETGNGLGVLACLQRDGATIYQRRKQGTMYPGELLNVAGFETNGDTKPLWVNELGRCIREQSIECNYLPAIQEMKTMLIDNRGRANAKPGAHDDLVAGPAIGLLCLSSAQQMPAPRVFQSQPRDVVQQIPGGLTASAFS